MRACLFVTPRPWSKSYSQFFQSCGFMPREILQAGSQSARGPGRFMPRASLTLPVVLQSLSETSYARVLRCSSKASGGAPSFSARPPEDTSYARPLEMQYPVIAPCGNLAFLQARRRRCGAAGTALRVPLLLKEPLNYEFQLPLLSFQVSAFALCFSAHERPESTLKKALLDLCGFFILKGLSASLFSAFKFCSHSFMPISPDFSFQFPRALQLWP